MIKRLLNYFAHHDFQSSEYVPYIALVLLFFLSIFGPSASNAQRLSLTMKETDHSTYARPTATTTPSVQGVVDSVQIQITSTPVVIKAETEEEVNEALETTAEELASDPVITPTTATKASTLISPTLSPTPIAVLAICGNNICEPGEADVIVPGGCTTPSPEITPPPSGVQSSQPICIGPPAQYYPGTCPADCTN